MSMVIGLAVWGILCFIIGNEMSQDEFLFGTTAEERFIEAKRREKAHKDSFELGVKEGRKQVKEVLEEQLPIMLKSANYKAAAFIKKATPTQRHNGTFHIVLEIANPIDVIKYKNDAKQK